MKKFGVLKNLRIFAVPFEKNGQFFDNIERDNEVK